jgi:hypothetical protein
LISGLCEFINKSFFISQSIEDGDKIAPTNEKERLVNRIRYDRQMPHKMRDHGYSPHKRLVIEGLDIKGIYYLAEYFDGLDDKTRWLEFTNSVKRVLEKRYDNVVDINSARKDKDEEEKF